MVPQPNKFLPTFFALMCSVNDQLIDVGLLLSPLVLLIFFPLPNSVEFLLPTSSGFYVLTPFPPFFLFLIGIDFHHLLSCFSVSLSFILVFVLRQIFFFTKEVSLDIVYKLTFDWLVQLKINFSFISLT